jgi:hypothetical protein
MSIATAGVESLNAFIDKTVDLDVKTLENLNMIINSYEEKAGEQKDLQSLSLNS